MPATPSTTTEPASDCREQVGEIDRSRPEQGHAETGGHQRQRRGPSASRSCESRRARTGCPGSSAGAARSRARVPMPPGAFAIRGPSRGFRVTCAGRPPGRWPGRDRTRGRSGAAPDRRAPSRGGGRAPERRRGARAPARRRARERDGGSAEALRRAACLRGRAARSGGGRAVAAARPRPARRRPGGRGTPMPCPAGSRATPRSRGSRSGSSCRAHRRGGGR